MEPLVLAFVYQMSASGENFGGISGWRNMSWKTDHGYDENFGGDDLAVYVDNLFFDNDFRGDGLCWPRPCWLR